jgi:hypothetical protein
MFKKLSTAVKGVVNEIGGNVSAAGGKKTKTVAKNTPDPAPAPSTTTKNTPDPVPAPVPSKAGTTYSGATSEAGMAFLSGGLIGGTVGAASSGTNGSSSSNSGNSNGDTTTENANGDGTDPNAQIYIIILTIIIIYVILKILKGKNYFLQNLIFIGIVILIYLYYYQDTTDTTNQ